MEETTHQQRALNWATLPAEIILIILEKIIKNGDSPFPYQLSNKHWYITSISIVYKSITLRYTGNKDFKNWEKLDSFCQVFKNTAIGPCVKEFTSHGIHHHLYLLGLIMKHFPNLEYISIGSSRKVCDYVASSSAVSLWENIKRIDTIMPYNHPGNYFYRYLYVFRNSLEYLHLPSIPNLFADHQLEDEETATEESDVDSSQSGSDPSQFGNNINSLCRYIKEFKNLKSLHLSGYAITVFMDSIRFLPFCADTLQELYLNFYPSNRPDIIGRPLSPRQDGDGFTAVGIKKLILRNYRPENTHLEFSYIQHTFPNLVDIEMDNSSARFWGPLTTEEINVMSNYVFGLPRFRLAIGHTVTIQLVKTFFNNYLQHTTCRYVKMDFLTTTLEGITLENHIEPLMRIRLNSTPLQDRDAISPDAIQTYENIIEYLGQHLYKLDLFDLNSVSEERKLPGYHAHVLNTVLKHCPYLQELSISGNMEIDLDAANVEKHLALHSIKFTELNKFSSSSDFFYKLSAQAPNLKRVHLDLDRSSYIELSLPFTMDLELEICLRGYLMAKMERNLKMEEEVRVIMTTTSAKNETTNRNYYTCKASGYTSIPKMNYIDLVHECNSKCQHISGTDNRDSKGISSPQEIKKSAFHIQCSSFKTFRLSTGFDYILRAI